MDVIRHPNVSHFDPYTFVKAYAIFQCLHYHSLKAIFQYWSNNSENGWFGELSFACRGCLGNHVEGASEIMHDGCVYYTIKVKIFQCLHYHSLKAIFQYWSNIDSNIPIDPIDPDIPILIQYWSNISSLPLYKNIQYLILNI